MWTFCSCWQIPKTASFKKRRPQKIRGLSFALLFVCFFLLRWWTPDTRRHLLLPRLGGVAVRWVSVWTCWERWCGAEDQMQQLITPRLDVSPLIYHQQSGALSHSSDGRELANTHTNTHIHRSCCQDALPLTEQISWLPWADALPLSCSCRCTINWLCGWLFRLSHATRQRLAYAHKSCGFCFFLRFAL